MPEIEPKNLFILIPILLWAANPRRFEGWLPYLGLLLVLALVTEVLGVLTATLERSNYAVYNAFVGIDFMLSSIILSMINPQKMESKRFLVGSGLIVLSAGLVFLWSYSPIDEFATSVLLIMGALLVTHSTLVILRLAKYSQEHLLKSPEFWVTLSPFFYFACFVPSFGLAMYFAQTNDVLAMKLYSINDYLFVLRYLLIVIGLIFAFKKQRPNA